MTVKCIEMNLGGYVYSQVEALRSKAAEKALLLLTDGSRQACAPGCRCASSAMCAPTAMLVQNLPYCRLSQSGM